MSIFFNAFRKMSLSSSVAVDLGTVNTVIWHNGKIVLNEPSIIAFEKSTGNILAIGNKARKMIGKTPLDVEIIKPMKDGVIAESRIAEEMLKQFLSQLNNSWIRKMIVCVPAGATEAELRTIRESCEHAGAKSLDLIAEPMAAAIGLGLDVLNSEGHMVVDIGGGTTEIAIIATGGIVCNQSVKIAGNHLTQCVRDFFKNEYNLRIGENVAEDIKEWVGSASVTSPEIENTAAVQVEGKDVSSGLPRAEQASVKAIREKALSPLIKNIIEEIKKLLGKADEELSKDIYEKGIWVTGGGALLEGLLERIREETNLPVHRPNPEELDPLLAVVTGTARVLQDYNKYRQCLLKSK